MSEFFKALERAERERAARRGDAARASDDAERDADTPAARSAAEAPVEREPSAEIERAVDVESRAEPERPAGRERLAEGERAAERERLAEPEPRVEPARSAERKRWLDRGEPLAAPEPRVEPDRPVERTVPAEHHGVPEPDGWPEPMPPSEPDRPAEPVRLGGSGPLAGAEPLAEPELPGRAERARRAARRLRSFGRGRAVEPRTPPPPLEESAAPPRIAPGDPFDEIDSHLVAVLTPGSFEAQQYLVLRHRVEQLRRAGVTVVAVTSPGIGDGKTTTAINLAGALAQDEAASVLLIDADLRHPTVASRLGLVDSERPGLAEAMRDALPLHEVVQRRAPFNLFVLPAGTATRSPYELVSAPAFAALVAEARRSYDFVILDTAPIVPFPDTRVIGGSVDTFLVVVSAHRTSRKMLADAFNVMDPAKVAGVVFNAADATPSTYDIPVAGASAERFGDAIRRAGSARAARR